MELLVRKASLALFLKEQHAYHERAVLEEIDRNARLKTAIEEATDAEKKLAALNEEIEAHPNVRELKAIIETASRRVPTIEEALQSLPYSVRWMYSVFRALEKVAASIVYK